MNRREVMIMLFVACYSRTGSSVENLLHECLEFFKGNLAWVGADDLAQHLLELFVRQMLTLTTETLLQILLRDEAGVVDVEVMEGERQVSLRDGLPAVNSHSQELSVVDLTIVVEVNALEDIIDLLFGHVKLAEGSPDLAELQSAGIVLIQSSEGVPQLGEVESRGVDLIHEESKSLDLEALRLTELGDTLEHSNLVRVE